MGIEKSRAFRARESSAFSSFAPARLAPPVKAQLRRRLLAWFAKNQRDLPWRHDRDAYRIWVSEVMLQQTQVATVIPYFHRFLDAFPTLPALAAAEEQKVLRVWEGLGYYRRARDLHQAARQLVAQHGGAIPDDPGVLSQLPGMGRYTLGAVLSQAFDRRLPILEANSQRVLCRLFGLTDDPRLGSARRWLWEMAEDLLPNGRVGAFNQALMELGALTCTPVAPRCAGCPLAAHCAANRLGLQDEIPRRATPVNIEEVNEVAVVVRRDEEVLFVRRPIEGRWAGLWEFPHGPLEFGETHDEAAKRLLLDLTGVHARVGSELLTIRHGVTRFRITLACLEARHVAGEFQSAFYAQGSWLKPANLRDYPVSAPQRRLTQALIGADRQQRLF